jgi:excisionase family DNA binding protein
MTNAALTLPAQVAANDNNSLFVTVDEAAAILGVGRNLLYQAIARGEVRGVKRIGKLIRIRRSALLDD